MFLAIHDPDKKTPATIKVGNAIVRYSEKFGAFPAVCLTSAADAADLEREAFATLVVRAVPFISRYNFYVGIEEDQ